MEVREAQKKDIPGIQSLLKEVLNIHAAGRPDLFIPDTTKYTKEELEGLLQKEECKIFVCVDEQEQVLGHAFCEIQKREHENNMTDIETIYIDDICVGQQYRKRNIGKSLYQKVEEFAKERGAYHITLNVWAFNEDAKQFYDKIGFSEMKRVLEKIL